MNQEYEIIQGKAYTNYNMSEQVLTVQLPKFYRLEFFMQNDYCFTLNYKVLCENVFENRIEYILGIF